jgi:hypothetical protein
MMYSGCSSGNNMKRWAINRNDISYSNASYKEHFIDTGLRVNSIETKNTIDQPCTHLVGPHAVHVARYIVTYTGSQL